MARIRTIKPEFPQSESMGRLSREARLCFILLWTVVDDSGRARASSRLLASLLYPYDADAAERMDGWLSELDAERCIDRYTVDGNAYLQISKWLIHQKIDRPSESRLPAFDESSRILANPRVASDADLGPRTVVPRTKDQGSNTLASTAGAVPAEKVKHPDLYIYEQYPRRVGKAEAMKAISKAVARLVKGEHGEQPMDATTARRMLFTRCWEYARSPQGRNPDQSFIPHPGTWFNKSRYLDDQSTWQHAGGSSAESKGKSGQTVDAARDFIAQEAARLGLNPDGSTKTGPETVSGGLGSLHSGPLALPDGFD